MYCIVLIIVSLFIRLQLRDDLQVYQSSRNIDYAWEGVTVTGTGIPAGKGWVLYRDVNIGFFVKPVFGC